MSELYPVMYESFGFTESEKMAKVAKQLSKLKRKNVFVQ